MRISGLQKLTLMDFPGVVACIVFTKGCNFRCPFCHNTSLATGGADEIPEEEVFNFLKERKKILDGVVITGGEPTLHPDLPEFIRKVKELGYLVKLDTNGTNPKLLKSLVDEGLVDYVAMDIKNSMAEYEKASGVEGFLNEITESKEFLEEGRVDFEFRTTAVKGIHTKESIRMLAQEIKGADKYFLQKYTDSGDILAPQGLSAFTDDEMQELLKEASSEVKMSSIR